MYIAIIDKTATLAIDSVPGFKVSRPKPTRAEAARWADNLQDRLNNMHDGFVYLQRIQMVEA